MTTTFDDLSSSPSIFIVDEAGNIKLDISTCSKQIGIEIDPRDLRVTGELQVEDDSIFFGNIHLSGSVSDFVATGSATFTSGISGSLTRLSDGTSYIAPGNNITITSASNGQVIIAATAEPGGSDTQVQYNDNGEFGGISGVTTDGSTMTFGDSSILVGRYITHDGDSDTKVEFSTDKIAITAGGREFIQMQEASTDTINFNRLQSNNFIFKVNNSGNEILTINDNGFVINEEGSPSSDFRVESNQKQRAIFVDGDLQFIHLLADDDSPDGGLGTDMSLYISGGVGVKGTTHRGMSVFGGDTFISGSSYHVLGISGSLTRLTDGTSYLVAGSNVTITSASNGQITIAASSGGGGGSSEWTDNNGILHPADNSGAQTVVIGGVAAASADILFGADGAAVFNKQKGDVDFRVATDTREAGILVDGGTDQVVILGGGTSAATSYGDNAGTSALPEDTALFVSGAIDSRGTSVKGTSIFGGDVVVSGTLSVNRGQAGVGSMFTITSDGKVGIGSDTPAYKLSVGGNMDVGEYIYHKNDADTFIHFADDAIGITAGGEQLVTISEAGQDIVKIGDGGDVDFQVRTLSDDNTLYVEGATDRVGIGTNSPGELLDVRGNILSTGYVSASLGLSGSLTTLIDGTSYLVAGSNVTITSASNGQVTIASTGGGGSGAVSAVANGSDNRVATFSSSDALNGEANLQFNGSALHVTGGLNVKYTTTSDVQNGYLIGANDYIVGVDTALGPVTTTLPSAYTAGAGRLIIIKDVGGFASASAKAINISTNGSETIDGASSAQIIAASGSISLFSDGSNWFVNGVS